MFARKGNKEVKINDIHVEEYLELGYTIFDDSLNKLYEPTSMKISKKEFDRVVAEKDKEIESLKKKLEEKSKKTKPNKEEK